MKDNQDRNLMVKTYSGYMESRNNFSKKYNLLSQILLKGSELSIYFRCGPLS